MVRATQSELDSIIQMGVFNITRLLKHNENQTSSYDEGEGKDGMQNKKQKYIRGTTKFFSKYYWLIECLYCLWLGEHMLKCVAFYLWQGDDFHLGKTSQSNFRSDVVNYHHKKLL